MVDWRPEVVDKLRELAAAGLSSSQIANQLNLLYSAGCSRNAVIGKLIRSKIPLLKRGRITRHARSNVPRRSRITNPLAPKKPRIKRMPHPIWSSEPLPEADREIEKYSLRLTYDQLLNSPRISQCRYLHTLDSGADVYCGNETALGTAWCEKCYRKVYRGPDGSAMQKLPIPIVKVS